MPEEEKGPRVVQPAVFLTERSRFTTKSVHPSQRDVSHNLKNREIQTMQKFPEAVTHGSESVDPDDIPEPTEIVDDDDLVE